jgi:hypothetical protein
MKMDRSKGLGEPPTSTPKAQHCGAEETGWNPRLAELDGDIPPDADRRQRGTRPKGKRRSRSRPGIPTAVRKEITRAARELNRQCRKLFLADPGLKDRGARLLRSLLPPKVKRGRPGIAAVTQAIVLLRQLRRRYPLERPAALWKRVYPAVIPNYAAMKPIDQKTAREQLRERVRWRRRYGTHVLDPSPSEQRRLP